MLPRLTEDCSARDNTLKTWLVFDGLDTFVTVKFCNQIIGTANNQFRQWNFDATSALAACEGAPTMSLNFGSAPKIANAINATEPQRESHQVLHYVQ